MTAGYQEIVDAAEKAAREFADFPGYLRPALFVLMEAGVDVHGADALAAGDPIWAAAIEVARNRGAMT